MCVIQNHQIIIHASKTPPSITNYAHQDTNSNVAKVVKKASQHRTSGVVDSINQTFVFIYLRSSYIKSPDLWLPTFKVNYIFSYTLKNFLQLKKLLRMWLALLVFFQFIKRPHTSIILPYFGQSKKRRKKPEPLRF